VTRIGRLPKNALDASNFVSSQASEARGFRKAAKELIYLNPLPLRSYAPSAGDDNRDIRKRFSAACYIIAL
jgi:hypothetical protein